MLEQNPVHGLYEGRCELCDSPFITEQPKKRFCSEQCRKVCEGRRRRLRLGQEPKEKAKEHVN